jgi:hypothetical protein
MTTEEEPTLTSRACLSLILALSASVFGLPLQAARAAYVPADRDAPAGSEVGRSTVGGVLPNSSDYGWWYGCSVTSAGMMIGHYDRNGYGGLQYPSLVPGGVAQTTTWAPWPDGHPARSAMASTGHQQDFYSAGTYGYNTGGTSGNGFGLSGDDLAGPHHSFDCLADFMGTSQDSVGNPNGWTTFFFFTNGSAFCDHDALLYGVQDTDGMYGIGEYVRYAGYDYADGALYTQLTDNNHFGYSLIGSFGFQDYRAEIDAGRPVLLQVAGHTMFGYGYEEPNVVVLNDTWTPGPHSMTWGGSYQGRELWGVTVLSGLGGGLPEPASVIVWSVLGALTLGPRWVRRRRAAWRALHITSVAAPWRFPAAAFLWGSCGCQSGYAGVKRARGSGQVGASTPARKSGAM